VLLKGDIILTLTNIYNDLDFICILSDNIQMTIFAINENLIILEKGVFGKKQFSV